MGLIEKTKKFLAVGTQAGMIAITPLLVLTTIGEIAPKGVNVEGYSSTIMDNIKNGIDTIAYTSFDLALTQATESYRHNVMEHLMKGRGAAHRFFIYTSDTEKKISQDNLKKAEKLGVFKDKEAFEAEVALLRAAAKVDVPNDRLFIQDNGVIDITDPSHFNGLNNIEQVKQRVSETLENLKNIQTKSNENKLKI